LLYNSWTGARYLAVPVELCWEPTVSLRHRRSEYTGIFRREEKRREEKRREEKRREEKRREEKRREEKKGE